MAAEAFRIESVRAQDMSREVALKIGELLVRVWPKPGMTIERRAERVQGEWGTVSPGDMAEKRSVITVANERVIAHACVFPRTVVGPNGTTLRVFALSMVCTDPAFRGCNVGQALVREAFRPVDEGAYRFSLFQTSERVSGFYQRLGCTFVDNVVIDSTADDPTLCPFRDDHVMRYPADREGWPEGTIDLCGPGY